MLRTVARRRAFGLGAVLDVAHVPDRVEPRFDEAVEAALGALQVLGRDGARVDDGAVRHPAGAGDRVQVALRHDLAQGSYLVIWR